MKKRRPLKKRLLGSPLVVWPLAMLTAALIRVLYYTNRRHFDFPASLTPYVRGELPAIFCFWHGRMIAQPFLNPPLPMYVLMSAHRDGVFIGTVMRCFGIRMVAGSRSRTGANALRGLMEITGRGHNISITPDGPRGPAQMAASGAAYLASKSGHPLIAVTFSATRHRRIRSWDRFMLPLPFGRIHFIVAEPQIVPREVSDAVISEHTARLEETLNRITAEADARCGVQS